MVRREKQYFYITAIDQDDINQAKLNGGPFADDEAACLHAYGRECDGNLGHFV